MITNTKSFSLFCLVVTRIGHDPIVAMIVSVHLQHLTGVIAVTSLGAVLVKKKSYSAVLPTSMGHHSSINKRRLLSNGGRNKEKHRTNTKAVRRVTLS